MSFSPVITVDQLRQQTSGDTLIVDCRFSLMDKGLGRKQYALGHIPGAYYLHLNEDLAGPLGKHGGRHPLPDTDEFSIRMNRLGLQSETLVVAYDDSRFAYASRLWWMLRYYGHQRVAVLDGGFRAWQFSGGAIEQHSPGEKDGTFEARPKPEWVADIDRVRGLNADPVAVLVDSRERPRFEGIEEPIDPVAGHIPGAVNYPWMEVTDDAGFVLPENEQQERWRTIAPEQRLIAYCGSGVTACVNLLSWEIAGRGESVLYPGSWSDWCSYLNQDEAV